MSHEAAVRNAVRKFEIAWKDTIADYENRRINPERCLQAALYHHLRERLGGSYRIFIEAQVLIGETEKIFIDTLVCFKDTIVAAVELKYKPKACPSRDSVALDLAKLIRFREHRTTAKKCKVALRRYRNTEEYEAVPFPFSPERRIIFAAYCRQDIDSMQEDEFWHAHRPSLRKLQLGKRPTMPPRLVVCLAKTKSDGTARPEIFGRGRFA